MKLKTLLLVSLLSLGILVAGCSNHKNNVNVIKVGTIAGPETDLIETAKKVAKERYGIDLKVITFTDYIMPNEALNNGSIDANLFQHQPYLDAQVKERGYQLASIGKVFVYPMGIYSKKIKNLAELPNDGKIAVPNDPSNEARALLLLQKAGLIKLRDPTSSTATITDIVDNPKNIQFIELDAAQLPRALDDVDAAAINNTYASASGLKLKHAIYKEGTDSLYVNILVVRKADENKPQLKQLLAAIQSKAVLDKAHELFGDGAITAFELATDS